MLKRLVQKNKAIGIERSKTVERARGLLIFEKTVFAIFQEYRYR